MTTEGFSTSPAIRLLPKIGKVIEYIKASVVYPFMRRTLLRTPQMWEKYQNRQQELNGRCGLCDDMAKYAVSDHKWFLIPNEYGYDTITDIHDLIVAPRHKAVSDLLFFWKAYRAYKKFKKNGRYDCMRINFPIAQSVPTHSHIHLIKDKKTDS